MTTSKGQNSQAERQRKAIFLRGLDSCLYPRLIDEEEQASQPKGFTIWINEEVLSTKPLRGIEWASVSIVFPVGAQQQIDPQQTQRMKEQEAGDSGKHAKSIIARIRPWQQAIDTRHAILDASLCASLGLVGMAGGIIRIEPAPQPLPIAAVKSIRIFPFNSPGSLKSDGLKFGGETRISREAAVENLRSLYCSKEGNGLLDGAVTDGLILPKLDLGSRNGWEGGLIRFNPPILTTNDARVSSRWCMFPADTAVLEVSHEILNPFGFTPNPLFEDNPIPPKPTELVGIDDLLKTLISSLRHQSSVLLNGGVGSGKTSMSRHLGYLMRRDHLFYVSYFDCQRLVTDEARVGTIKDTINKLFMRAAWGCKLGGASLVILDNLDKLCPGETELQVGSENDRNRQLSELIYSTIHQYCAAGSRVAMLATSQGKDALNSVLTRGHLIQEFVDLKAPSKEKRREILQFLAEQELISPIESQEDIHDANGDESDWMDTSMPEKSEPFSRSERELGVHAGFDFSEIAGQTDGYMPGDFVFLLARVRSEAIIRTSPEPIVGSRTMLTKEDFQRAIKGYTPASLRSVTLQTSSLTFKSIGGLKATREILLETLQYPTKYAPIFAQCPLRLRSGLLLYGYPGCGKTLLASAVAGECDLNFISVKGPEILNKYIGASEKSVRDLFERAVAARPCVLFFDEFDSIAPKRGHDSTGVTDRVVNQLLTQMDGAEGLSGVYVLAATSRPDLIDPALLRPGRLDKSLLCDMPSEDDRMDIMLVLSKKLRVSSDVLDSKTPSQTLAEIARITEGYSGADLQALVYNAQLEAIHDVLGNDKRSARDHKSEKPTNKHSHRTPGKREFIHFSFGEQESSQELSERATLGFNKTKQYAERAEFAAKIEYLKLVRHKERNLRHGILDEQDRKTVSEDQGPKVTIHWKHLAASLASTRSSISLLERKKLETIYREFTMSRNGEMPSGQGPTDVGARSSLM